jgi:primase-polymerase (primpol)-like protein
MTAIDHKQAESARRSAQDAQQRARIRELGGEVERYRKASEDALQQLDWCIGYLHGTGRMGVARSLAHNRSYIRTHLLRRAEEPVPSQQAG